MNKYLKGYTLTERWETFKKQDVSAIFPLISALEELSRNPTDTNIDIVRQLEKEFQPQIKKLDLEDQKVLDDMVIRILYQASNKLNDDYTRWDYTLARADDKGIEKWFEMLNNEVMHSEESMTLYKSSGESNEDYIRKQQGHLEEIDKIWEKLVERIESGEVFLTKTYRDFFEKQLDRKRVVIKRHIDNFDDNKFGEWLKAVRNKKGWSLARASEETNTSPSYIHRIERGVRSVPSVTKLEQLAEGYKVPYNKMIIMASGGVQSIDQYIQNGAFTIRDKVATAEEVDQVAELTRLISENDLEGAQDQLHLVIELLNE